jgi:hypothetical protein
MLGRKSYSRTEIESCKTAVKERIASYKALAKSSGASKDKKAPASLAAFEPIFCNTVILALDRHFVHRLRMVTGKDGTPLNELEMLADALINNKGKLRRSTVIRYVPEESILKLKIGANVSITLAELEQLAAAVFDELESKYLTGKAA